MDKTKLIRILAERVMEWEEGGEVGEPMYGFWVKRHEDRRAIKEAIDDWNPLTDWNDCMMLVEQMAKDGFEFDFRKVDYWYTRAKFGNPDTGQTGVHYLTYSNVDDKKAICIAAAKAKGLEYEPKDVSA